MLQKTFTFFKNYLNKHFGSYSVYGGSGLLLFLIVMPLYISIVLLSGLVILEYLKPNLSLMQVWNKIKPPKDTKE